MLMICFALLLTIGILAIIFQVIHYIFEWLYDYSLNVQEKVITELKVDLPTKLQREYGLQSSFTAAMDLAQTKVK